MKQKLLSFALAVICCLNLALTALAAPAPSLGYFEKTNPYYTGMFSDVSGQDWFAENVRSVYEYGLMIGNDNGQFSPKNPITLAQALAITCRLHSVYHTGTADFTQGSPWYQVYVDYAAANGILGSVQGKNYASAATRRDLAGLLVRAMPDALTSLNNIEDGAVPDVAAGSANYSEIYTLYRAGVVNGSGDTHVFNPDTNIRRSEVAAMVTRLVDPSLRQKLTLQAPKPTPPVVNTGLPVDSLWKGTVTGGAVPAFGDTPTEANVLALLDRYDPDGAFILRKSGNYMTWFNFGGLLDSVDTAVHEQYHSLSFSVGFSLMSSGGDWTQKDVYYAGNGILLPVTMTKVYNSREMIPYIPENLRDTFRFDTYIDTSEANLTSVKNGIYGLMNEFTAYSCGMNNTVNLYDYYKTHARTMADWRQYANLGANDRLAYAEFRYYMLTYLLYAKDKYPDVYSGIVNNSEFKQAFRLVDDRYAGNIQRYEQSLNDLKQFLAGTGHQVQISEEWFFIDNQGTGIFGPDYQKLMSAMSADNYQKELAVLKG